MQVKFLTAPNLKAARPKLLLCASGKQEVSGQQPRPGAPEIAKRWIGAERVHNYGYRTAEILPIKNAARGPVVVS